MDRLGNFIRSYDLGEIEWPPGLLEGLEAMCDKERFPGWGSYETNFRRCGKLHLETVRDAQVINQLKELLRRTTQRYVKECGVGNHHHRVLAVESPLLLWYKAEEPGQPKNFFHAHVDSWDLPSSSRALSILIYLNDVEEGGETRFPHLPAEGTTQDTGHPQEALVLLPRTLDIKPKRGRVAIFPSGYPFVHEALEPLSGDKKVLVSWLHFGTHGQRFSTIPLY